MDQENAKDIAEQINQYKANIDSDPEKYKCFYTTFVSPQTILRFNVYIEKLLTEKEKSLKRDKMMDILIDIVFENSNFENLIYSTIDKKFSQQNSIFELNKFINILVSLPEIISNLYEQDYPRQFSNKIYISRLSNILERVLFRVHQSSDLKLFNLYYIHCIIRRICLKGYQEIVWTNLLGNVFNLVLEDAKWQSILRELLFADLKSCQNPVNIVSDESKFLEPMFKMIFYYASGPMAIERIFSFNFLKNNEQLLPKIKFILTNKFVLIFHCPLNLKRKNPDQFLFNLLGYLYLSHWDWFMLAINNILDMWSDSNAFNYRLYQQQYYLCRLIILSARLLLEIELKNCHLEESKQIIEKLQRCAFKGATVNLSCSQFEFRSIGHTTSLILFDSLVKFHSINIELPKFEELESLTDNDDCLHLKHLGSFDIKLVFETFCDNEINENIKEKIDPVQNCDEVKSKDPKNKTTTNIETTTSPLDSDDDDDFQPYDLSNDISIEDDVRYIQKNVGTNFNDNSGKPENVQNIILIDSSKYRPIYLQDCMEGLCDYEKPDWMEKCLRASEKIIRANFCPPSLSTEFNRLDSVALRFAQLLFDLDNKCSIENFEELRLNSLIALCVGSPKIVASYLTDQFYAQYISVRNRMDVLAVLTMASEELSRLKPIEYGGQDKVARIEPKNSQQFLSYTERNKKFYREFFTLNPNDEIEEHDKQNNWKSLIEEKIRTHTKYIAPVYMQKQSESYLSMSSNRFVPVAKYFFFPLLRDFERLDIKLNIKEEDSFVVESLILALGVLLQNCSNHSQTMLMTKELLPFIYSYRKHNKSNVRSAIIHTFNIIIRSTSAHFLMNDLLNQMIDFELWLQDILINDINQSCMAKAYQALNYLTEIADRSEEHLIMQTTMKLNTTNRVILNKNTDGFQSTIPANFESTI